MQVFSGVAILLEHHVSSCSNLQEATEALLDMAQVVQQLQEQGGVNGDHDVEESEPEPEAEARRRI